MQSSGRRAGRGTFIAASHALVVVFVASSASLPLFNYYRTSLGLTNADISVVVVGYFAGTIGALLFLGRLASHVGRKPAAMSALVLLAIGCLVLVGVDGLAPLVAGRVLMGLGAGLASSSITAYIVDAAPARPPWLASVASSQALNLGMTVGALGAGALVMFAPWPTRLVYVLATMWLIVCIVLVAVSVETDERRPGAWASLRPRVRFAPRARRLVPVASVILFSTWAMGAFYQAFVPSIVSDQLGTTSALAFAVVFCAYMLPNVIGAPISGLLRPAGGQRLGMLIFITGVGTILLAIQAGSLPLFILGSLLGGTGQGVSISSSVGAFLGCTTPSERAPLFAGIYLIGYSGSAIPTLVSGQISHVVALPTLALGYGALSLAAAIFPDLPATALDRTPRAKNAGEADFLALGEGARLWLTEAAAAGTTKMRVKMAAAVELAKLFTPADVDWALGHAAVHGRFAEADLASILDHHRSRPHPERQHASEERSLTQGTQSWAGYGQPDGVSS